jgi:signal transduction histidine kinase
MIVASLPILAGIISIALAILIMIGGTNTKQGRWPFVGFALSVGLWAIGIGVFSLTSTQVIAEVVVNAYYICALFIAYALMMFCLVFTTKKVSPSLAGITLLPWIVLSILIYPFGFMFQEINAATHTVALVPSFYALYAVIFCAYALIALSLLWHKALKARRKKSYRLLALSLTVSLIGGGLFNLFLPGLGTYEYVVWGPLFTFVMVASVFYVIVRHGLFDIRLAFVRTVTYILSLATLAAVYWGIAFLLLQPLFGASAISGQLVVNLILALVLAFIFQPVRRFFDKVTNKIFYRDNYSVSTFFSEFGRELTGTTNLRELLSRSATKIAQTIKIRDVSFVVYKDSGRMAQIGYGDFRRISQKDARWIDTVAATLPARTVILASLEDARSPLGKLMAAYRISALLPLGRHNVIIGYLVLGEQERQGYSRRDINVISTLSDELVIAVQNALAVEQIRDINANLEQRIDNATKELRRSNAQLQRLDEIKDEFISMASHQLRTPLTSIKGYLSMLIEGDLGELTKEQKHVLSETFVSSERMVRLIGDFLNVSRLQTGKFVIDKRPVDLAEMVRREIDALEANAAARNIKFVYKKPKNIPTLELDENKIEQVIMNFADNAIYYSQEQDVIKVTLKKIEDFVEFTVEDRGIGVPQADQAHMFTKFYRASNARKARPDGTGVGLFLAKKVIDDHGGSIIFKSTEGEGSTFGFRLPISQKSR